MAIQFLEDIAKTCPGVVGHGPHRFVGSRKTTANAPAGVFMVPAGDGLCELPDTAAKLLERDRFVSRLLVDRMANANGLEYASGDYVQGVAEGYVTVLTEEAVSDQDPVYVRITASGGNTQLGACRNDGGTNTALLTVITTADNAILEAEINGVQFQYHSTTSQTAAQKATAFAALIDATAAFAAAAVGAVITVTPASGAVVLGAVSPAEILTAATGETAVKLPGVRFVGAWDSGVALINLRSF